MHPDRSDVRLSVCVFGLGYVGLPLALACVDSGLRVTGFDPNSAVVAGLLSARSHVDDISDLDVQRLAKGGFTCISSKDEIPEASVYVICVPTPLSESGSPDLQAVESAASMISGVIFPGALVVLESTTYPGTTEEIVVPILERSGLRAGVDFSVAFSPERIDPGNPTYSFANTPKVIGGLTELCLESAVDFYSRIVETVVCTKGLREAEMAKLLENTYRHVNIALVNELARLCHGLDIDIWDAISAAETKPYGFQAFRPGPGVGGHCIPIDPNYLSHRVKEKLGEPFRFVELAQEINASMPHYIVHRVQALLNSKRRAVNGSRVLMLGVTYKSNIADTRESPAFQILRDLRQLGATVAFHDPFVSSWVVDAVEVERLTDLRGAARDFDCVVLLQSHSEYLEEGILEDCTALLDTRGVIQSPHSVRL